MCHATDAVDVKERIRYAVWFADLALHRSQEIAARPVVLIKNVVLEIDILVSSTSDFYFITSVHMKQQKNSSLLVTHDAWLTRSTLLAQKA